MVQITDKDVDEVKNMLRRIAIDQFETHGEVAPFFAVLGDKLPTDLEQLTKQGALPLQMTKVTTPDPELNLPVLVGFYLHGMPKSIWNGLMTAVAADVNATALMFSVESWIVPSFGSREEIDEFYAEHDSLSEHPDAAEQIHVSTNWRDGSTVMERAMINPETRKLEEWEILEPDLPVEGRFAGLKW